MQKAINSQILVINRTKNNNETEATRGYTPVALPCINVYFNQKTRSERMGVNSIQTGEDFPITIMKTTGKYNKKHDFLYVFNVGELIKRLSVISFVNICRDCGV